MTAVAYLTAAQLPPDGAAGLGWAVKIHRYIDPAQWKEALQQVPEAVREEAAEYLRGIYRRKQVADKVRAARETAEQGKKR